MSGFTSGDLAVQVTSVTISDRSETSYTMPEDVEQDDYAIIMDANPLLTSKDQASDALAAIYHSLSSVAYRPYECPYWGDPSVQAGDLVFHHTWFDSREPMDSIITKHVLHFGGFGTLSAEGEHRRNRQMTDTLRKISEARKSAAQDLNDSVVGINQDLAHQAELVTNSMGFYVDYDVDPVTGPTRFWMMDAPDPQSASIIWRFSAGGAQVSHDHGQTFTSGWTADNTIVAHIIRADMIKTGVLRAQDNTLQIDLSSGRFNAQTQSGSTQATGHPFSLYCKQPQGEDNISLLQLSSLCIPTSFSYVLLRLNRRLQTESTAPTILHFLQKFAGIIHYCFYFSLKKLFIAKM